MTRSTITPAKTEKSGSETVRPEGKRVADGIARVFIAAILFMFLAAVVGALEYAHEAEGFGLFLGWLCAAIVFAFGGLGFFYGLMVYPSERGPFR